MSRTIKSLALVLKINPVGEYHRGLSMLVAGEGLLRPLAFGAQGRRSALRASAVPYNTGMANLYYDGSRDQWRLTAFDIKDYHDGIRHNLDRYYMATAWAKVLLSTYGSGGDSMRLYHLAARGLSLLSNTPGTDVKRLNAGFLWQFLFIEGMRPDVMSCGRCGKILAVGGNTAPARFWPNGLLVCPRCAEFRGQEISDGARVWLQRISDHFEDAVKIGLSPPGVTAAEQWIQAMVQAIIERPLSHAHRFHILDSTKDCTKGPKDS